MRPETTLIIFSLHHFLPLQGQENRLPEPWLHTCRLLNSGNNSYIPIVCHVTGGIWELKDFRSWSAGLDSTSKVSLDITCSLEGKICLPWPYRADKLDTLKVKDCINVCYYSEYYKPEMIRNISDTLRVFEGRNVTIQTTLFTVLDIDARKLSPDVECGPRLLETYVDNERKTSLLLSDDDMHFLNATDDSNITDTLTSAVKAVDDIKHVCRYNKLKIYDISRREDTSSHFLYSIFVNSFFPEMTILNISDTEHQSFPGILQKWNSRYPKLRVIDLSHNNVSRFDLEENVKSIILWKINMTHNSIETIGNREINSFQRALIDIRENPLRCDCAMSDFHGFLISKSPETAGLDPSYSYLWSLKCETPSDVQGRKLTDLTLTTLCRTATSSYRVGVVVLGSIAVVLVIVATLLFLVKSGLIENRMKSRKKPQVEDVVDLK